MTIPYNPMPDGTCRTIKRQYQQSGLANFLRGGCYGATGVIEIEDNRTHGTNDITEGTARQEIPHPQTDTPRVLPLDGRI